MPLRRFSKPKRQDAKGITDTALTESTGNDLALFLAQIVQEDPDLTKLIEAWPTLSKDIRAAILRLAER